MCIGGGTVHAVSAKEAQAHYLGWLVLAHGSVIRGA